MNKNLFAVISLVTIVLFFIITLPVPDALARAGKGGSFGSRGTRSYSQPGRPSPSSAPARQQAAPSPVQPSPVQQQAGGGFLRGMGGGILGGLLGGMLFSSLGFGALGNGLGGSGFGIFEILLIGALGYLIIRTVRKKRTEENLSHRNPYQKEAYQAETLSARENPGQGYQGDLSAGLSYIRQMDPGFEENRVKDMLMDVFFKVQGAWMNRDLSAVQNLLTGEMKTILQKDIDALLREKRVNRLENIAVRNIEITEAWQESGQDFITVLFRANLLDYTTDDSGQLLDGSRTEPVKFEEYWTFTRNTGNNPWQLSAINQG